MIPISRSEPFSEVIDQTIAQRRSRILFEMSSASSVEERFSILAILLYPRNYGRYKAIQRDTGVMSTHWHHVVFNRQKLTSAMIQAFGRKWPEYIFWMVVGQDNNAVNNEHPSILIDSYLKFHEDSFVKISL